jgi:NitT/TauT family transport system ATP-binding protein
MLRIAAGLVNATDGSVDVRTDHIGYVFQDPTLLPWRNVRSNVELFGELRRLPKQERRRRADAAIGLVGLDGFARHRPHTLSGGPSHPAVEAPASGVAAEHLHRAAHLRGAIGHRGDRR